MIVNITKIIDLKDKIIKYIKLRDHFKSKKVGKLTYILLLNS